MSDTIADATDEAPEAETTAEETTAEDPRITKANQEAARYRKELRTAQAELEKARKAEQAKADADKTEAEKRAAAEQRAVDAEMRATRLEVAHEKGLTPAQAKRLVGTTREEFEADADEILRDFPVAVKPAKGTPAPDPSQGAKPPVPARAKTLTEAIANARKASAG